MKDWKMLLSHAAVCLLINKIPPMVVGDKTFNHLNLTVLTCTEMENSLTLSPDRECNETHIRLAGGGTTALYQYGRVEICLDGFWGRVQVYRWDYKDAKVVCRQLGYDGCEFFLLYRLSSISFPYLIAYTMWNNFINYGTRFYHLGDVGCIGNETALINCEHGVENVYGYGDAGVICSCMFTFSLSTDINSCLIFSRQGMQ